MTRGRTVMVGLAVAAGVALRIRVMASGLTAMDSDEAVVALIAMHLRHGHVDLMFWGQPYGGTIEAFFVAPLFAVFGASVLVARLSMFVLSGLATVLCWRVGRRVVGEPAATIGALVFWVASPYYVWWSTKVNIYYGGLCLALTVVLLLRRLAQDDEVPRWWPVAFGLAAGACVWANPQTMYLLVPAGVLHVRVALRHVRRMLTAAPFAVLGAAPWLVYSARNHWSTLHFPNVDIHVPYPERVLGFFRYLPIVAGFRLPLRLDWVVSPVLWVAFSVVFVAAVAVAIARNVRGARLLVPWILGYVAVYAISPQAGPGGTQPRYLLFATPLLALLVGMLVSRRMTAAVTAVVAMVALSVAGLQLMDSRSATVIPGASDAGVPTDISDLVALLDEHHVRYAYANYWLSFRATFETRERTIVVPVHWEVSRYEPYAKAAAAAPAPAFVVLKHSVQYGAVRQALTGLGVAFETDERGDFALVLPDRNVDRDQLAGAYRA